MTRQSELRPIETDVPAEPPTGWWRHLRLRAREDVFDRVRAVFKSFKLIGWQNSMRAVIYTMQRSRIDSKAFAGQLPSTEPKAPGALESAEAVPGGARFHFATTALEVRFLNGGGVFVGWDGARAVPSYALGGFGGVDVEPEWTADSRLDETDGGWQVRANGLVVEVDAQGALTFREDRGAEAAQAFRYDPAPAWSGPAWTHRSVLDSDAAVFGLGGRSARMDRKGRTYRLWNTDPGGTYTTGDDPLCLSIPVYLVVADAGTHLAFYDNTFDGTVEVGPEVVSRLTNGPLRYYVFADGSSGPAAPLEQYTRLTGRPALPPRWALGYHQCRWGYGSEAVVRQIVEQFEQHDLPLSAIWLDIDHLVDNRPFAIDKERYPDLGAFTAELAESDTHVVVIADPGVGKQHADGLYRSGLDADAFCRDADGDVVTGVVWPGWSVFADFTAERARQWWGEQYKEYLELGVGGFWHDMNEPSSFVAWGDGTLPLSTRHDFDGRGGDHREAHNVYALSLNHAGYEAVSELRPGKRPFLLSRSGFAGLQRYAGTWSGDIETSWEGLRISLTFTIGLGCSGVPYSGPDIGGFDDHPSNELYVRWFQLGAYLPFFRVHCAAALPPREPWALGADVLAQVRPALLERYELLPYWYALAWEAHRTGAPYVRPMVWADPSDSALRWEDDQFMLGDALLVAPVLEEGVRERTIRLPKGRWYDRWTGVAHEGPGHVTVQAGLQVTPVMVRAGSVIPVEQDGRIVLQAYPLGDDGAPGPGGRLLTDSGDGYDEPVEERFSVRPDRTIAYEGPAGELPYDVVWPPQEP